MKIPRELRTLTPLSRALGMVLFITFPILGFLFGTRYEQAIQQSKLPTQNSSLQRKMPSSPPDLMSDEPENIGTYEGVPMMIDPPTSAIMGTPS